PDVTGKTIPDVALGSFTEWRVEVPQGVTFELNYTNAQLEISSAVSAFERRLVHEDEAWGKYYREAFLLQLSNDITVWQPSLTWALKRYRPTLTLIPLAGTGGEVGLSFVSNEFLTQTVNHSAIA